MPSAEQGSRPRGSLVLGVDSSTQSVKIELRDIETGRLKGRASRPHPPTSPPVSEQDPEAWWEAMREAINDVGGKCKDVAAISVAGQQHGLVLLDSDGRPLRPAKLWNDTTSAADAKSLVDKLGPDGWANACGSVPVASFTISKMAWVAHNEPGLLERSAHVGLPHDYLTWKLSDEWVTDRGDASGTGWWSPDDGQYVPYLLNQLTLGADLEPEQILERLPRVLGPSECAGTMTAEGFNFRPDTLVGPGTGDNMAAALGLGLRPGDVVVSLGTSGTVYAVSHRPTHDVTGAVAGFADASGNYLPLVCTLNATKVSDAAARVLGADYEEFDALALSAPAGSGGLVTVPWFDGERTPNRPDTSGSMFGLTPAVTQAEFARSAVEGVACGLLEGVDRLQRCGVDLSGRFFLIGGGAKSKAYQTVFASLGDREIIVPDTDETVATGACVQAAACATSETHADIAQRWGLGSGKHVAIPEPRPGDQSSSDIRDRYRSIVSDL